MRGPKLQTSQTAARKIVPKRLGKNFVLECKLQRVSSDCAIFANTRSSVVEFGKGEEWLILVGGISASYRKFSYARRNEQKSTQLTQRAGMNKNPHGGRRTGGFHTVTFSPRRNEQKSTRVGQRAGMSRFPRQTVSSRKYVSIHVEHPLRAGMSKNPRMT